MSCKFTYKGKDYDEAGLIKALSNDPEIREKYFPQEERPSGDYTKEDLSVFKAKVSRLQEAMNVKVAMDSSVESSRVLGKNDKRVEQAGKPVILINPKNIFKTTAIHEFGHIFIDSFPKGIENPRLKKALKQLQGTDLEAEVKELYPDLSQEMFEKELIVTAIGRTGADIWDAETSNAKTWRSIKDWFFSFIQRTFGLQKNEIESLTKELLDSSIKKSNLLENASLMSQEERKKRFTKDKKDVVEEKVEIQTLERTYREVLARIKNIYNEYRPNTNQKRLKESLRSKEGTTRFESITALKEEMEALNSTDRKLGLTKYIKWVSDEVNEVNRVYELRKANNNLTDEKVLASIDWNHGFGTIDDIQNLILGLEEAKEITPAEAKLFSRKVKNIQGRRSELESKLLKYARESYATFMSENDNKMTSIASREFEQEYDDLRISETGKSKDQYVMEKLNEYSDDIKREAYNEALANSEKSISDISKMAATMWSEKNATSQDIQSLSTLVDRVELNIAEFAVNEAVQFDSDNKDFKKNVSNNVNQKVKYDKMITTSSSGLSYYASQYKPEFLETKNDYIKKSFDPDEAEKAYGDIKVTGSKVEYTITDDEGKTHKRLLRFGGGIKYKVTTNEEGKSVHVSYELNGERVYMPTAQAIARSEYDLWIRNNTELIEVPGKKPIVSPIKKWVNQDYNKMTQEQKKHLNWLKNKVKEADELTESNNSLISRSTNQEWIRLPGILKTDVQRIAQGNYTNALKQKFSELTEKQKDDFETEDSTKDGLGESFRRVYADISNQEKLSVPIPFRKKLESKEQSLDLHTITLMNTIAAKNYAEKKQAEKTFLIVLEVMKSRKVPDTASMGKLKKVHAIDKSSDPLEIYKNPRKGMSNDAKKALDMLEGRIYGIKSKDAGSLKVLGKDVDINQLTKSWLKLSGMTSLIGNIPNSIVNASMARINNRIEAFGGEHFNNRDLMYAEKTYLKDMKGIMEDIGSNVDKSRTNLFLNVFNVMGGKEFLDNKFEQSTRGQALMKMNSLRPIAKAGEHMMQSHVMYATMRHIKVMNSEGKYIDVNGDVVSDKKKAASIDQMIEFTPTLSGGVEMKLDKNVGATTFTKTGGQAQIMLETRNLIKYKVDELHGNYDPDLQAAAQKEWYGKLGFFLRKWIESGYFRRWRGIKTGSKKREDLTEADQFYSQDAKGVREGYYITAWRFISKTLVPAIRQLDIDMIKKGASNLSDHEKANFKKVATELMLMTLTFLAYASFGDDDDDETILVKYTLRRQLSELLFFIQPGEAMKIVMSPTASSGTLKNIISALYQFGDPSAEYERGKNKGRNKLTVKMLKNVPGYSQTLKDLESSLNYIESSAGFQ